MPLGVLGRGAGLLVRHQEMRGRVGGNGKAAKGNRESETVGLRRAGAGWGMGERRRGALRPSLRGEV